MTRLRRCLEVGRALAARHQGTSVLSADEFRVFLAELEAALDAESEPARELEAMGERTSLELNTFGFPAELNRS